MPKKPELAMKIEVLRKKRKLSQAALGELIGVTRAAVSLYELGKNKPSFEVLVKLADHLRVDINELMGTTQHFEALDSNHNVKQKNQAPNNTSDSRAIVKHYKHLPLGARATFADSFTQDYDFNHLESFPVVTRSGDPEEGLVVDIDGDSMDPQLKHGMSVLVEPVPAVDGWKAARPGVYVIVYRNYFVIKRIKENTLDETGKVWLHSDNPDGGREQAIIDDIRGMWRVIRIVHAPVR